MHLCFKCEKDLTAFFLIRLHVLLLAAPLSHTCCTQQVSEKPVKTCLAYRTYFKQFTYGTTACVRPVLQELVPNPDPITMTILQQVLQ